MLAILLGFLQKFSPGFSPEICGISAEEPSEIPHDVLQMFSQDFSSSSLNFSRVLSWNSSSREAPRKFSREFCQDFSPNFFLIFGHFSCDLLGSPFRNLFRVSIFFPNFSRSSSKRSSRVFIRNSSWNILNGSPRDISQIFYWDSFPCSSCYFYWRVSLSIYHGIIPGFAQ